MDIKKVAVDQINIEYKYMGKDNYLSLTEWHNGEGFDVSFSDDKIISLSYDELHALNLAYNYMQISY